MTLDQLRGLDGAAAAEAAWAARGPAAAPGADCDASIVPVVSGHVDPAVLDRLAAALFGEPGFSQPSSGQPLSGQPPWGESPFGPGSPMGGRVRRLILRHAADLLSGPAGLAAFLRTGLLPGPAGTASLPLDVGKATEQIPGHLRRAVIARDRHCAFPGCRQRPAACQVHHLRPRSKGGGTSLTNLLLLCAFHHLIAVHRWGWQLTLHPDATVTAVSPDGLRTLHSHGPPARAA
jgi:hypothetical protein